MIDLVFCEKCSIIKPVVVSKTRTRLVCVYCDQDIATWDFKFNGFGKYEV